MLRQCFKTKCDRFNRHLLWIHGPWAPAMNSGIRPPTTPRFLQNSLEIIAYPDKTHCAQHRNTEFTSHEARGTHLVVADLRVSYSQSILFSHPPLLYTSTSISGRPGNSHTASMSFIELSAPIDLPWAWSSQNLWLWTVLKPRLGLFVRANRL